MLVYNIHHTHQSVEAIGTDARFEHARPRSPLHLAVRRGVAVLPALAPQAALLVPAGGARLRRGRRLVVVLLVARGDRLAFVEPARVELVAEEAAGRHAFADAQHRHRREAGLAALVGGLVRVAPPVPVHVLAEVRGARVVAAVLHVLAVAIVRVVVPGLANRVVRVAFFARAPTEPVVARLARLAPARVLGPAVAFPVVLPDRGGGRRLVAPLRAGRRVPVIGVRIRVVRVRVVRVVRMVAVRDVDVRVVPVWNVPVRMVRMIWDRKDNWNTREV